MLEVIKGPGDGGGGVFQVGGGFVGWAESVAWSDDDHAPVEELFGEGAVAPGESAAVEPDDGDEVGTGGWVMEIEPAAFPHAGGEVTAAVEEVGFGEVGG